MKRLKLITLFIAALALLLAPMQKLAAQAKNIQEPFASAARTATTNSSAFDVYDADVLVAYLNVTANGGTSPTLDVKFQDSPDGGTTWFDIAGASFTQVTGSTSSQVVSATRKFATKVRCVATIGGTSPTFTFSVRFMAYRGF